MFRNTGGRMPAIGTGSMDLRSMIGSVLNAIRSKTQAPCTAPCDGFILKMHYRWTTVLFIAGFFTVWYSWYYRDVITCVSHFNADTQVRLDYINICLSYPFVIENGIDRRYILFYRWIHFLFLLMAFIYYIPRKVSKNFENVKAKKLLEDLAQNASRYDQAEAQIVDRAALYLRLNMRTHNGIYIKFVFTNIIALVVDIFAFLFLDFVLQGRFARYGFEAYPFERDPKTFTDYMSVMFPPFAKCELDEPNMLLAKRKEVLGCHLALMELYEKIFLLLWVWMIIMTFVTCLYIVFLVSMLLPCTRRLLLRTSKPRHVSARMGATIEKLFGTCKIGDMFILYKLKQHLSHARFYELMEKICVDHENVKNAYHKNPPLLQDTSLGKGEKGQDTIRNRQGGNPMNQNPPVNPDFSYSIQQMNAEILRGQHTDIQQRTPLLKPNKNTSILIE